MNVNTENPTADISAPCRFLALGAKLSNKPAKLHFICAKMFFLSVMKSPPRQLGQMLESEPEFHPLVLRDRV